MDSLQCSNFLFSSLYLQGMKSKSDLDGEYAIVVGSIAVGLILFLIIINNV
jgi:hypothetical protein